MEITVLSEEENPMLHRTDVRFRVSHAEATPDRLAVRDSLAARLNKDADEVVVRRLDTKFGMRETVGEAKVYQGPDFAEDVEQDYMLARNSIGDRAVEEEPPEAEEGPEGEELDVEEAEEGDVEGEDEAADEEEPEDLDAEDEPAEAEEEPDAEVEEAAEADAGDAEEGADDAMNADAGEEDADEPEAEPEEAEAADEADEETEE